MLNSRTGPATVKTTNKAGFWPTLLLFVDSKCFCWRKRRDMETTAEDFLKEFSKGVDKINEVIKKYKIDPKRLVVIKLADELKFSINREDLEAISHQIPV